MKKLRIAASFFFKVWQHPVGGFLIFFAAMGAVGLAITYIPQILMSPAERASFIAKQIAEEAQIRTLQNDPVYKAQQAAASEARIEEQRAAEEEKKYLCRLKTVCKTYATVRQDCATAGNFNNCINVKMGDDDAAMTGSCSNDGKPLYPQAKVPDNLECLFIK